MKKLVLISIAVILSISFIHFLSFGIVHGTTHAVNGGQGQAADNRAEEINTAPSAANPNSSTSGASVEQQRLADQAFQSCGKANGGFTGLSFKQLFCFVPHLLNTASIFLYSIGGTIFTISLSILSLFFNLLQPSSFRDLSTILQLIWSVVRDMSNILVVITLVMIGLGTILNLAYINAKKNLIQLLIAAVLINFSFFFTMSIINISNNAVHAIIGSEILNAQSGSIVQEERTIELNEEGTRSNVATDVQRIQTITRTNDASLANSLLLLVEAPTICISNELESSARDGTIGAQTAASLKNLMNSIFILIVFILMVVIVLSILITIALRFIFFMYSIIASPFGILGLGLPEGGIFRPFASFAKDWWGKLLKTAVYLPIYILMIIITISLSLAVAGALVPNGSGTIKGLVTANNVPCEPSVWATSYLAIIILIISLIVLSQWFKQNAPLTPPVDKNSPLGILKSRAGLALNKFAKVTPIGRGISKVSGLNRRLDKSPRRGAGVARGIRNVVTGIPKAASEISGTGTPLNYEKENAKVSQQANDIKIREKLKKGQKNSKVAKIDNTALNVAGLTPYGRPVKVAASLSKKLKNAKGFNNKWQNQGKASRPNKRSSRGKGGQSKKQGIDWDDVSIDSEWDNL